VHNWPEDDGEPKNPEVNLESVLKDILTLGSRVGDGYTRKDLDAWINEAVPEGQRQDLKTLVGSQGSGRGGAASKVERYIEGNMVSDGLREEVRALGESIEFRKMAVNDLQPPKSSDWYEVWRDLGEEAREQGRTEEVLGIDHYVLGIGEGRLAELREESGSRSFPSSLLNQGWAGYIERREVAGRRYGPGEIYFRCSHLEESDNPYLL
jgi:hypothetical protein